MTFCADERGSPGRLMSFAIRARTTAAFTAAMPGLGSLSLLHDDTSTKGTNSGAFRRNTVPVVFFVCGLVRVLIGANFTGGNGENRLAEGKL